MRECGIDPLSLHFAEVKARIGVERLKGRVRHIMSLKMERMSPNGSQINIEIVLRGFGLNAILPS